MFKRMFEFLGIGRKKAEQKREAAVLQERELLTHRAMPRAARPTATTSAPRKASRDNDAMRQNSDPFLYGTGAFATSESSSHSSHDSGSSYSSSCDSGSSSSDSGSSSGGCD